MSRKEGGGRGGGDDDDDDGDDDDDDKNMMMMMMMMINMNKLMTMILMLVIMMLRSKSSDITFLKLASLNLLVSRSPTTEKRASCPTLQQPAVIPRIASAMAEAETFELTCSMFLHLLLLLLPFSSSCTLLVPSAPCSPVMAREKNKAKIGYAQP